MQVQSQVVARNTGARHVVLSSDAKGSDFVEWAGKDDPNGNDVQMVPESIANSVPFIKACQRGLLVVDNLDENEALQQAIQRQNQAFTERTQKNAEAALNHIDEQANNDLISLPCVGPGERSGQCGQDVPVRDRQKDEKPPLCSRHEGLKDQFVPSEDFVDQKRVVKWVRTSMGPRQTQQ